jgi:import inner membrane translocase subunit TIM23
VLAGLAGGAAYFGSMELDATKPIMVREVSPISTLRHSSFRRVLTRFSSSAVLHWVAWACTNATSAESPRSLSFLYLGAGYLVGPIIGSTLWRVTHRRTMALIEARDREFHQHIVKNRVDPRAQSATNPVPDFYGEYAPNPAFTMPLRLFARRKNWLSPSI